MTPFNVKIISKIIIIIIQKNNCKTWTWTWCRIINCTLSSLAHKNCRQDRLYHFILHCKRKLKMQQRKTFLFREKWKFLWKLPFWLREHTNSMSISIRFHRMFHQFSFVLHCFYQSVRLAIKIIPSSTNFDQVRHFLRLDSPDPELFFLKFPQQVLVRPQMGTRRWPRWRNHLVERSPFRPPRPRLKKKKKSAINCNDSSCNIF